jgi:hypothetical protein
MKVLAIGTQEKPKKAYIFNLTEGRTFISQVKAKIKCSD